MIELKKLPMNLQFFADPNPDPDPEDSKEDEPVTLTQKELQSKLDSEADKRAAKAVETAKAKWEADKKQALEDAKNEGAKLAKMSAAEKADAEMQARVEEIEKREAALKQKELKAATKALLQDNGLPADMSDTLIGLGDAEAIKNAVETLKGSIDAQVNQRVEKIATGTKPVSGSSQLGNLNDISKKDFDSMTAAERLELFNKNPDKFNEITGGTK
ncbi:capsid assembly scaffolding protein Gp46 family protein [Lactiplantibacillus argentoratensis]|jgi:membrane protein involved in colicin uptake